MTSIHDRRESSLFPKRNHYTTSLWNRTYLPPISLLSKENVLNKRWKLGVNCVKNSLNDRRLLISKYWPITRDERGNVTHRNTSDHQPRVAARRPSIPMKTSDVQTRGSKGWHAIKSLFTLDIHVFWHLPDVKMCVYWFLHTVTVYEVIINGFIIAVFVLADVAHKPQSFIRATSF